MDQHVEKETAGRRKKTSWRERLGGMIPKPEAQCDFIQLGHRCIIHIEVVHMRIHFTGLARERFHAKAASMDKRRASDAFRWTGV